MSDFNLIENPWIPCIDLQGRSVEYGICDTLLKAHELREICDESPLVTVAIHRLLLAILYRAHEGPCDFRSWRALYQRGSFDQSKVTGHLNLHRSRFNLVDDDYPFFQMAKLETKTPISVTRLATECASGNNATQRFLIILSTKKRFLGRPPGLRDGWSAASRLPWDLARVAMQPLTVKKRRYRIRPMR